MYSDFAGVEWVTALGGSLVWKMWFDDYIKFVYENYGPERALSESNTQQVINFKKHVGNDKNKNTTM